MQSPLSSVCFFTALMTTVTLFCTASCTKSTNPAPKTSAQATIASGSYKITEDQGSDNGDTVYYTRTMNACEASARYTFAAKNLTLTSTCTATATVTWAFNPATSLLTITDSAGNAGTVKIEHLTATGFVWNAIATGEDNARYTMQLVN